MADSRPQTPEEQREFIQRNRRSNFSALKHQPQDRTRLALDQRARQSTQQPAHQTSSSAPTQSSPQRFNLRQQLIDVSRDPKIANDPIAVKTAQAHILVQAAINHPSQLNQIRHFDLSGVDLTKIPGANRLPFSKLNLQGANMAGMQLQGAKMRGANLQGANLGNADLSGADLTGAKLQNAQLQGTTLKGAQLGGARFDYANLERANLEGAHMPKTNFYQARMSEVNMNYAKANGANFSNAGAVGAKMARGDFSGANFDNSNLSGAQAVRANLNNIRANGTTMVGINLRDASMAGVKAVGINISGNLTNTNLKGGNWLDANVGADLKSAQNQPRVQNIAGAVPARPSKTPVAQAYARLGVALPAPTYG